MEPGSTDAGRFDLLPESARAGRTAAAEMTNKSAIISVPILTRQFLVYSIEFFIMISYSWISDR